MYRKLSVFSSIVLFAALSYHAVSADNLQQELITATPARIALPTPIPTQAATAETTFGNLTAPTEGAGLEAGAVMLESKSEGVNVRAEADINAERLGSISPGELYPVIGRYFRWIQFQYESSPTGRAWVYDELVNIVGDASAIEDLSESAALAVDPAIAGATGTQEAITQTPGGVLTSTALARILSAPVGGEGTEISPESLLSAPDVTSAPALPTYTFPPNLPAAAPTRSVVIDATGLPDAEMPPIVPILALGGLGLVGLALSSIRR